MERILKSSLLKLTIISCLEIVVIVKCIGSEWGNTLGITMLINSLLFLLDYNIRTKERYLAFQLFSVGFLGFMFLGGQYTYYTTGIPVTSYILGVIKGRHGPRMYQMISCSMIIYLLTSSLFMGRQLKKYISGQIDCWLPPMWTIILVCFWLIMKQEDIAGSAKLMGTVGCIFCLIVATISAQGRVMEKYKYYGAKGIGYVLGFGMICSLVIGAVDLWPEDKELPGATWLHEYLVRDEEETFLGIEDLVPLQTTLSSGVPMSERILFEVEASEPLYLRKIAYSEYEDNTWKIPSEEGRFIPFKSTYLDAEYDQFKWILKQIEWIAGQDEDFRYEYAEVLNGVMQSTEVKSFSMHKVPADMISYLTTNGMKSIDVNKEKQLYYYYQLENIFFSRANRDADIAYTVTYVHRLPEEGTKEYAFLKMMNAKRWDEFYKKIDYYQGKFVNQFNQDMELLKSYTPQKQYEKIMGSCLQVPDEIRKYIGPIAEEVIGSLAGDLDKAKMIETYLKKNYTYSLDKKQLAEGEDQIYDFLFESKKGICQDFATTMVLMCRSIGLPTRYVTGYVAREKDEKKDVYIVREKDAHAFVEIYFAGYGWVQFDPTPALPLSTGMQMKQLLIDTQQMKEKVISIMIVVVMILACIPIGKWCYEMIWCYMMKKIKIQRAIECLLKRSLKRLNKKGMGKGTYETLGQYGKRLETDYGLSIYPITEGFEAVYYGQMIITQGEVMEALETYKKIKKFRKKSNRKKKIVN